MYQDHVLCGFEEEEEGQAAITLCGGMIGIQGPVQSPVGSSSMR